MGTSLLQDLLAPGPLTYRRLVTEWFGARDPSFGVRAEELHPALPTQLRDFYEFAGRWPRLFVFNQLQPPDKIAVDPDGRIVFLTENQAVCAWATEPGADPAVHVKGSLDVDLAGRGWHREGEPLSRFLLQAVLLEAALGSPFGGVLVPQPAEIAEHILEPLSELPLAPWLWPATGSRFWAADDVVAVAIPQREGLGFAIGARAGGPLAWLRELPRDARDLLVLPQ